jgi:hypothetical protein
MRAHIYTSPISYFDLIKGYSQLIVSLKPTHVVTISTRYTLTLQSARRLAGRVNAILVKKGIMSTMFWVAEKFDVKDGEHIHALFCIHELDFETAKKEIYNAVRIAAGYDGINKKFTYIKEYIVDGGMERYMAKYLNQPNALFDIERP